MSIKVKCRTINQIFSGNNGYRVVCCSPTEKNDSLKLNNKFQFSIAGCNFPYIEINREYEIEIEPDPKSKYVASYILISCPSVENLDVDNLTRDQSFEILMCCTSSERIANSILDVYPDYIKRALTDGADKIDTKNIKGVGIEYNKAYCRNLNEKYKYLSILNRYKELSLDVNDCERLYTFFSSVEKIDKAINESPYYVLINVLKRNFVNVDLLLKQLRPDLKISNQRCEFCIADILSKNEEDGNTYIDANDMYIIMRDGYDVGNKHFDYNVPELLPLVVETCNNSDTLYYDPKTKRLSILETYLGEVRISNFIKEKLKNSTKLDIDWTKYTEINGFKMTPTQAKCLENFVNYNFSLLVGNSGSGKTSSVKGLIKLIEDNHMSYTLLAPTGKASMRMSEATHRGAYTIHRKCLKDKEINSDALIIDEGSMTDIPTFIMLISCITNPNCRIVLVGDNAQLMPVGIGCPFNDIINSKIIPTTMLTEIFRYTSNGALYVATHARKGEPFLNENNDIVKHKGNTTYVGDNYKFIQVEDDKILDTVLDEYKKLINSRVDKDSVLVLSPFNVGDIGTYSINNVIQEEFNPPKAKETVLSRKIGKTNIVFRLDDRVINKKNDYKALPLDSFEQIQNDPILSSDDVPLSSIFNGQTGIIRNITDKYLVVQFDEEMIVIDKFKLNNLLLSSAISVHSSQGSEADYVINIVSPKHSKMLNRNILYVADTRGKKFQTDIGDVETYNLALLIDGNELRDTWLCDLLLEEGD